MPKKGGKAALKKKIKQQNKPKDAKNTATATTTSASATSTNTTNNTQDNNNASGQLSSFINPDIKIKEFIRDIHIHNFTLAPIGGGLPLIQGSDIKLIHGHRYGLIGYNGAGKTTLLHQLAGGNIKEIPPYLRVLHVHQELEGNDQTVLITVMKADKEREELLEKEAKLRRELEDIGKHEHETEAGTATETTNGNSEEKHSENAKETQKQMDEFFQKQAELDTIVDRLKFIEADTAEARASAVLDGLQFTDRMKNMKTADLSGGWRMRVSLACALFIEPDLLLLDEPTNHLDFPSVIWLSEYLSLEYPKDKTIVIVSHDRRFLNDVCTDIIHLDSKKLVFYKGNYDTFVEVRRQSRIHQRKQYERQQKMIKHNEEFIARFKANKKWSTQAQSRMKLLAKTNKIEKVLADLEFRFHFPEPPKLKNPNIFHLDDVTFGYFGEDSTGKSYLLHHINLRLQMGTKVGLLGANGAGKSTLVRLIMNEIDPLHGTCALSNSVEVGYFAQHHIETLDYEATPLEHLKNVFGEASMQQIYAQLGRFNLGNELAKQKIGTLSGGQKSRVAFSILTWYAPHLIIMDEPTNHLDLPTIDALGIALADFEGSVILVSHDQHFVETVCDEYWAVGNRTVRVFDDFEACRTYCFKECKPMDILPREFSTIEVKKTKYKVNARAGALNKAVANQMEEEKDSGKVADLHIDPEREIDKGLEKGLTPDSILRHIRGWNPVDGDVRVVHKLGFIMFHDYFDKQYSKMHASEFFERWKKLAGYCIPINHTKNQMELVDVAHACWRTANKDKNPKTQEIYSFGLILETMTRAGIITQEAVQEWREKNGQNAVPEAIQDIERYVEAMQEENDAGDDDSDSD